MDMLATGPGIVGVGTARNFHVPVTVCVRDSEPEEEDLGRWDHVAEASLPVPSGCLMVRGCTEARRNAARIAFEPGLYRVCVYYLNLDSVSANGIEGDDSYKVVLWPSWEEATRVLKRSGWRERNPRCPRHPQRSEESSATSGRPPVGC